MLDRKNMLARKTAVAILSVLLLLSCSKKEVKQDLPPEDAIAQANALINDKKYDDARDILTQIKYNDKTGKYIPASLLRTADSYALEGDPELAADEYRSFLKTYPGHKYAPYAQYKIAMIFYKLIKGPDRGYSAAKRAYEAFQTLQANYPRNPYRETVQPKMQRCLQVMADYEFMVGDFYYKKKSFGGALQRFLGILEQYPDYEGQERVLYLVASSYRELGDGENALRYLNRLAKEYPGGELARQAEMEIPTTENDGG